jgi:hypothetical protein
VLRFLNLEWLSQIMPNTVLYDNFHFDELHTSINCDRALPIGRTVVHASGLGDISAHATARDLSHVTGFAPEGDLLQYQSSSHDDEIGSAVQAQGDTVGFWIDSTSAPVTTRFKVAQWAHCWRDAIYPWAGRHSTKLCVSFEAAVPHSDTSLGATHYAYMAMAVRDCATQTVFWIQHSFFDVRGKRYKIEGIVPWAEMNSVIALSFFGGKHYCTPLPHSATMSAKTWREWRYFASSISSDQLLRIIASANTRLGLCWSGNLEQYRLELIGVGPEVCIEHETQGHLVHGKLGMKMRRLSVWTTE